MSSVLIEVGVCILGFGVRFLGLEAGAGACSLGLGTGLDVGIGVHGFVSMFFSCFLDLFS